MRAAAGALAAGLLLAACGHSQPPLPDTVPAGTWGGEDAGMIVSAEGAHVHVGCTLGFTALLTDTGQSFESGLLVLGREPSMRNCPICRRPPAWLAGRARSKG